MTNIRMCEYVFANGERCTNWVEFVIREKPKEEETFTYMNSCRQHVGEFCITCDDNQEWIIKQIQQ